MCSVIINGDESGITGSGLQTFADLIELIKNSIDPEHMITGILIDGRELEEQDWQASLNQFETKVLEIETGTPADFVSSRMASSADIVRACFMEFREGRKSFQEGSMQAGNQKLLSAVNTLQAFFEWYGTLIELLPEDQKDNFRINSHIDAIAGICKRICQQQLYQSWWALGETIQKELEPKLDELETFCRKFSQVAVPA